VRLPDNVRGIIERRSSDDSLIKLYYLLKDEIRDTLQDWGISKGLIRYFISSMPNEVEYATTYTVCVNALMQSLHISEYDAKESIRVLENANFIKIYDELVPITGMMSEKYPKSPDYLVSFLKR